METIENNKLIAEFLGLEWIEGIKEFQDIKKQAFYKQVSYNSDWNELMQVIEKIREIDQKTKGDFKTKLLHFQRNNKNIFDASILEGKEYVYKLVVEFIKWYNQNN